MCDGSGPSTQPGSDTHGPAVCGAARYEVVPIGTSAWSRATLAMCALREKNAVAFHPPKLARLTMNFARTTFLVSIGLSAAVAVAAGCGNSSNGGSPGGGDDGGQDATAGGSSSGGSSSGASSSGSTTSSGSSSGGSSSGSSSGTSSGGSSSGGASG